MSQINICETINCPFYKSTPNSGCDRYMIAFLCHLLHKTTQFDNYTAEKIIKDKILFISHNSYALFGDLTTEQITELKLENDKFFLDDKYYLKHKLFKEKYNEQTKQERNTL